MKNKKLLGVISLGMIVLLGASLAMACPGSFYSDYSYPDRDYSYLNSDSSYFENQEEIRKAIESRDYGTWKDRMSDRFTEDNFNRIADRTQTMKEVQEAMISGDYNKARELRTNSGYIGMSGYRDGYMMSPYSMMGNFMGRMNPYSMMGDSMNYYDMIDGCGGYGHMSGFEMM
jgi:hypothetical protein